MKIRRECWEEKEWEGEGRIMVNGDEYNQSTVCVRWYVCVQGVFERDRDMHGMCGVCIVYAVCVCVLVCVCARCIRER